MCTGFLCGFREALFDNTRYGSVVESYSFESALLGPLISIPCSSSSSQRTRIAHESSFRPASRAACLPRTAAYSSCIEQYSRTVRGNLLAPWVVTPFALFLKRTHMAGCSNTRTFGGGNVPKAERISGLGFFGVTKNTITEISTWRLCSKFISHHWFCVAFAKALFDKTLRECPVKAEKLCTSGSFDSAVLL